MPDMGTVSFSAIAGDLDAIGVTGDTLTFAGKHLAAGTRNGVPGADYAWSKPSISALKAAGEVFVAQYDSLDAAKNLTPARAHDLLAAGIKIVLVYEYGAQDMLRGKSGGQADAKHANALAKDCHMNGIPIYFAADWDATEAQQDKINAYLDGAASVIGKGRVGMYGGYWPVSRAKAAGKISYLWGTVAWSGGMWTSGNLTPDIMQGGLVNIGGVQCDLDAGLSSDYGQWPRPAAGNTSTWQAWLTKGHTSLEQVAEACDHMNPASVLRRTALKYGSYDAVISAYLNDIFGGKMSAADPIPAGGKLWVRV